MANQQYPIKDPNTRLLADAGAYGTFLCDSSNPFDAEAFSLSEFGPNSLYVGYAIKFFNDALGNPPVVASHTANGLYGKTLNGAWTAGVGFAVELLTLTMTTGVAEIILKKAKPIKIT